MRRPRNRPLPPRRPEPQDFLEPELLPNWRLDGNHNHELYIHRERQKQCYWPCIPTHCIVSSTLLYSSFTLK